MARIHDHPDIGFRVVGYVTADADETEAEIEGSPVLGGLDALVSLVQRHQVEEVFFAAPDMGEDEIFHWISVVQERASVVCKVVANMLYVIVNRAKVDEIIGLPVIAFRRRSVAPAEAAAKRALDLTVTALVAVPLLPLAALLALWIKLDSKGPALFVHKRVGYRGREFDLFKFRTMRTDVDPYSEAPNDETDARVTRCGRWLRRTSLDELPQLYNILRGDMSWVGPRPEMRFIVDAYKPWQAARLKVRPGLTGLWQVAGRKNLPLHFNLEYDFYYVQNQSLVLDLEILLRTVPAVLIGQGAY